METLIATTKNTIHKNPWQLTNTTNQGTANRNLVSQYKTNVVHTHISLKICEKKHFVGKRSEEQLCINNANGSRKLTGKAIYGLSSQRQDKDLDNL